MKKFLFSFLLLGFAPWVFSQSTTSLGVGAGSSGSSNTNVGYNSGRVTTGSNNSIFGASAGYSLTTGSSNALFGTYAGHLSTNSTGNVFFGYRSGSFNISGGYNTYLGYHAGYNSNGSRNIFLGNHAGYYETGSDKLYIENSTTTSPLVYGDFSTNILLVNGSFTVKAKGSGWNDHFKLISSTGAWQFIVDEGASNKYRIRNENTSVEAMTFTTDGNVGIGNPNPIAKMHISDPETIGGVWNPARSSLIISSYGSSLIIDSNEIYSNDAINFGSSYEHDFIFRNVDTQGHQDLMVIKSDGSVGIGTSTPNSKLAVDGKITAREVEVTAEGWADFVFEEDYDLPGLADVEAHIKNNKHLPGIPSVAEVTEKGINLGAMDALLLQKIEELTLYMIEQEKKVSNSQLI